MRLVWVWVCRWLIAAALGLTWPLVALPAHVPSGPDVPLLDVTADTPSASPLQALIRTGLPITLSVQEVSEQTSHGFERFDANQAYALDEQTAVWLQWRVRVSAHNPPWTLIFSKPFVDQVALYYQDAFGQWQRQVAGRDIPHAQWPVRRLLPQFVLPRLPAGEHTLYLKLQHDVPLRFGLDLWPEPLAQQAEQNRMLHAGLVLGFMVLMIAVCMVMALSYGDRVFVYYGIYVVCVTLWIASFLGVGGYALWPQWPKWSGIASCALGLLGLAAQLQFCRAVFLRGPGNHKLIFTVQVAVVLTIVSALAFLGPYSQALLLLFGLSVSVCVGLMLWMALRALLQRSRIAWWWLLSYLPLYIVLGAAGLEHLGVAAAPWLPLHAPVYALVLEVLVLMVALHLYGKAKHAQRVRVRAYTRMDPATGLLTVPAFDNMCQRLWRASQEADSDVALAYVKVMAGKPQPRATPWTTADGVQRCARLLHQVLRSQDWVCRISEDTLAIVMPGMGLGDILTERFSRLVALGLMGDAQDPQNQELRFRIAVGTQGGHAGGLGSLRKSLMAQMTVTKTELQSQPPITYLGVADYVPSQSELEELWDHAMEASGDAPESTRPMTWLPEPTPR